MIGARFMEPEWLDGLDAHDPRAIRSRRDIRRLNGLMLQTRIMAECLELYPARASPQTIVEFGSGDGTFMLQIAKRLAPQWRGARLIMVDRHNVVTAQTRDAFARLGWTVEIVAADIFAFIEGAKPVTADVVCTNLFLHHFAARELSSLLQGAARLGNFFVACEPRRCPFALASSRLLWAIGCNDVSRHDAVASVRAGFTGAEISAAWPEKEGWALQEEGRGLFTHCFVARRAIAECHDAL